ncbi:MAG: hypothetical protein ACI841_000888 [Planctomycetota bacterium]|jgi:uncharacterized protein (DUF1800 family)
MWTSLSFLCLLPLLATTHAPSMTALTSRSLAETNSTEGVLDIEFPCERTTLWLGRTSVVAFACSTSVTAEGDFEIEPVIEDSSIVSAPSPAKVLGGRTDGSLRLKALAQGTTRITLAGATLEVIVRALPAEARSTRSRPEIVVPVQGARLWGTFAVACELSRAIARTDTRMVLESADGRRIGAIRSIEVRGPTLRTVFDVDASKLAPGSQALSCLLLEQGVEVERVIRMLTIVQPAALSIEGECEDALRLPRPEAFGESSPRVGGGADSSGGRYVMQASTYPQWVVPITVAETGSYQLMLRAKGDRAAGAYPSVGVSVDGTGPVLGSTRLVHSEWHRVAVGKPLELEAGEHVLALRFLNDLNVGSRNDRNLYLDRYELLRVEADEARVVEASMMMTMDASTAEAKPVPGDGLWIAFNKPLDGLAMNGRLRIEGHANWGGAADSPAPTVSLIVDGARLATQQSAKPIFKLDRAHLGEGTHEIQLSAAMQDGRQAVTPVQVLQVPGFVVEREARDFLRWSVLDEAWGASFRGTLEQRGEEVRHRVAWPTAELTARLYLPEHLEGRYRILLEARASNTEPISRARVRVDQGDEQGEEHSIDVRYWWSERELGEVDLRTGPKQLTLVLGPRSESPELRMRSLALERVPSVPDIDPPVASILYPKPGHYAFEVDAVVVEAFDDDAIESVDVLIDGRPQGTHGYKPSGCGHFVLPLLLRGLAAGEHRLAVRVTDKAGNLGESQTIRLQVLAHAPAIRGAYARALHLLNRLAFGPAPRELGEILLEGQTAWLERVLADVGSGDRTAREFSRARIGNDLAYQADKLTIAKMLRTDNPVRARFVLWVDNHFSTWSGKTGAPAEWGEHFGYAEMGIATFGELLLSSATSPTMLRYLDQPSSYAGRLNENYARELMELHTLGVDGGYTQQEVTEMARVLCGLTVSQEAPPDGAGNYLRTTLRFAPDLSDGDDCQLLGRTFSASNMSERYERLLDVLQTLAGRPETARHIARKLAEHYVCSPAPTQLVEDLSAVYLESGGDFRRILAALAEHPTFWSESEEPRLTSPLDYGLRVARTIGFPQVDGSMCTFLNNSGMGLFDRATPDGYPDEDEAWADTNGLLQRWRWVQNIPWAVRALVPRHVRQYSGGDPAEWRQRVVDVAAVRLTGGLLGESSNEAALSFLADQEGNTSQRVDSLTLLMCRLPEASLK